MNGGDTNGQDADRACETGAGHEGKARRGGHALLRVRDALDCVCLDVQKPRVVPCALPRCTLRGLPLPLREILQFAWLGVACGSSSRFGDCAGFRVAMNLAALGANSNCRITPPLSKESAATMRRRRQEGWAIAHTYLYGAGEYFYSKMCPASHSAALYL